MYVAMRLPGVEWYAYWADSIDPEWRVEMLASVRDSLNACGIWLP